MGEKRDAVLTMSMLYKDGVVWYNHHIIDEISNMPFCMAVAAGRLSCAGFFPEVSE